MKRVLIAIVVLCCSICAIAAGQHLTFPFEVDSPKAEIVRLENLIAEANANGQTPNPLWTERLNELLPPSANVPPSSAFDVSAFQAQGGFAPGAVIRPQQLTPLEEQIKNLEFQIHGGLSNNTVDAVTFSNLKDQLNALYSQRSASQPRRNPLDQGNDACAGAFVTGIPYTDSGSTAGQVDNYAPSCGFANGAPDVIYEFTPSATLTYNISLEGSNYDTELYIRTSGDCPGTSEVACNDDWFGLQSFLSVTLNAGQTYFIIVDGYRDLSGDYVLNITDNCNIDCQSGDAVECDEAFVDLVGCNGGCNSVTPLWQTIYPCQTMCGRGWAAAGGRDTDWYSLTLTEPCSLSVTLNAEFAAQIAFIEGASCPFGAVDFYQSWAYPCSTVTFLTQCLQPGTYTFFVSPLSFGGTLALREYRARIDLVPCSGCRVDGFLQAPGSVTGNTCGEGNDNSLRPSVDYTYCVNIPYESDWTISLCNDDSTWDSYIYLSTQCNGGVIAFDDDRCGTTQLSKIDCIRLTPGNYYLDIEGYFNHCGAFNLQIVECIGRCCYGEPTAPSCLETTISDCDSIGGFFHEGEECSVPCPVHHGCQDASLYGQPPILPGEPGVAYSAHIGHGEEPFDNFAVSGPVGTVRFWGLPLFCDSTITFQISLTSETDTCIYTVSTVGVVMPEDFFGWQLLQYDVQLSPPCGILSGNIAIGMVGNGSCQWYWESSPYGDDVHPYGIPHELSFCLGTSCEPVDSLTINLIADNNYLLSWWQPQAAQVDLYTSTDPNAVYPVGFNYYGSIVVSAGHIAASYATADPFNYAVLILNCAVVPPPALLNPNPVFRKQTEIK